MPPRGDDGTWSGRPCSRRVRGLTGQVGARPDAVKVKTLRIDKPGLYENIVVDGEWIDEDLARITADNVVLRNCTIRYGRRDALEVYGRNVRVENCHIHHVLAGTFRAERNLDAHGITGRPLNLTIRNTEISHVSGDAIQFDPSRKAVPYPWDNVLVEHCFLWTGPLDKDYAGFKRGERPGENAFDSKTHPAEPRRSRITFRNCLLKGWGHGAIENGAALNLKEKVQAVVDQCVFVENDIAFRCRGSRGSAWVTARNCTIYETARVFRLEDKVQNVKIFHLALGERIGRLYDRVGAPGEGFEATGSRPAPALTAWPYSCLPVGGVIAPGNPKSSADDMLPTALATGWEGAAGALRR
ncbi:MAG: right-handed parallel beta-helix repeat-containing protein [Verrucomicrobiota bacterium]|nr:right-handed parallel beta-helix repeat-containing protein [Verrucomicrobiota bacterium]